MQHELEYAAMQGFLGSVDAKLRDLLLGWDTINSRRHLLSRKSCSSAQVRRFHDRRLELHAKVASREFEPIDLFYAHIRRHGRVCPPA